MTTHAIKDLRNNLGKVVREALADPTEDHIITDRGTPVAAIVPLHELRRLRDQAWMAELDRRAETPLEDRISHEEAMRAVAERSAQKRSA